MLFLNKEETEKMERTEMYFVELQGREPTRIQMVEENLNGIK